MRGAFVGGVLGAAAAYLLDPRAGAGRRARMAGGLGRLLGLERAPEALDAPEDDLTVLSRTESVLHAIAGFPRYRVELEVVDGRLTLTGDAASREQAAEIAEAASAVRGVTAVENRLRAPEEATTAPPPARRRAARSTASPRSRPARRGSSPGPPPPA